MLKRCRWVGDWQDVDGIMIRNNDEDWPSNQITYCRKSAACDIRVENPQGGHLRRCRSARGW